VITAQGVSKSLGKRDLFQGVSFHIHQGERIGLIGPNGAGKTTLFHILLGETEPDTGMVTKSKNLRLGYLPQQWMPVEGKTVLAHAMDVDAQVRVVHAELERVQQSLETERDPDLIKNLALQQAHLLEQLEHLGGYDLEARAHKILAGLGFSERVLDNSVATLSGGWGMRLELARLLLSEPDLLLLDEPTNHLDLDSLLWLEQYLLNSSSAMMIVSHDRAFLNRVVGRIFELEQTQLQEYTGNYDSYLEEKARRQEIQLSSYKNQQERIRQIERFIERNRYRKDKARQVQSRVKMLDKIERVEVSSEQGEIHFSFPEAGRSGKRTFELRGVEKSYGERVIYAGVDLVIERGDRIAFMGPNGAGKTTLLKILAGVEDVTGGEQILGHQVKLGYYAQHQWEQLHTEWTVLEEASSIAGNLPQAHLRGLLGSFLFRGDDVLKRIAVLSGGEKARLILCKLLLQRPNALLLDEPTNHLDIPSRNVLESALEGFPGTICFISHDRHFIDAIATKILVVHAGKIHVFPGSFNDYQTIWKTRMEEAFLADSNDKGSVKGSADEKKSCEAPSRKGQEKKRLEAQLRNELYRCRKPVHDKLEQVEAALEGAHKHLDSLNERLADPDTYRDGSHVQELQKEYQQCQQKIEALTGEWEKLALALEEMEENYYRDKQKTCGC